MRPPFATYFVTAPTFPSLGVALEFGHANEAFEGFTMTALISAPSSWIESVSNLRLPPKADGRLQELMDRNNEGQLSAAEHDEMTAWVELSEQLSLVRVDALQLLGRRPQ